MMIQEFGNLIDDHAVVNKPITLNVGRGDYVEIVDVVFCQGCDQYHIISERPNKK